MPVDTDSAEPDIVPLQPESLAQPHPCEVEQHAEHELVIAPGQDREPLGDEQPLKRGAPHLLILGRPNTGAAPPVALTQSGVTVEQALHDSVAEQRAQRGPSNRRDPATLVAGTDEALLPGVHLAGGDVGQLPVSPLRQDVDAELVRVRAAAVETDVEPLPPSGKPLRDGTAAASRAGAAMGGVGSA
ncbi:hypothetical protein [Nonomuraea sp. B19D2]|uniref:hypothetical protein n=1 Tax=Nonomuraea sp. B19D2 TaxID=3159561 RepID=UPI0032DB1E55